MSWINPSIEKEFKYACYVHDQTIRLKRKEYRDLRKSVRAMKLELEETIKKADEKLATERQRYHDNR